MIEVSGLTKRYSAAGAAVQSLSFHIEKGHIYGLLGLNGAGKTTTLNLITGALSPTEGEISVCGHDLLTDPIAAKACIGYLPENPPLYPDMTPAEYLTFVARAKGIGRADVQTAVRHVLNATGTDGVKNKLISTLSKGYRQRIGIAQAMLGDPPILILDEPTVGLDPGQVIELRRLILSLGKDHTVILSSHILSEVSEVCDRILILSGGRLAVDDSLAGLQKLCPTDDLLEITTALPPEKAKELLSRVPGIVSAQYTAEDGITTARLTCSKDVREAVFFAFASAHRAILSMNLRKFTLEDIFLRVIAQDNASPSPKKGKKRPSAPNNPPKKESRPAKRAKISLFTENPADPGGSGDSGKPDGGDDPDGEDYRPLFRR